MSNGLNFQEHYIPIESHTNTPRILPSLGLSEQARQAIEDRLSSMTLRQKVGQLVQLWIRTGEHAAQVEPLVRPERRYRHKPLEGVCP